MGDCTIVGIGEILWDVFPEGKQLGGAPANFAYHCKMLGAQSYTVSCIGDDQDGKEIIDMLAGKGVSSDYIAVDANHPTGTVTVEVDDKGKPEYIIHEHVAWDNIPLSDSLLELAKKADAVCYGSLAQRAPVSHDTIQQFLTAVKADCIRVFDINLRQHYYTPEIIKQSLEYATVLKLNDEELPVVADMLESKGCQDVQLLNLLNAFNLDLIVLTMGAEGSRLVSPTEDSFFEGIKVEKIADTVGAGDSFTAAVTVGLLRKDKLDVINKQANELAAYVCSQAGAMPPVKG